MINVSEEYMLKARAIVAKWAKYENEITDARPTYLEALIAKTLEAEYKRGRESMREEAAHMAKTYTSYVTEERIRSIKL